MKSELSIWRMALFSILAGLIAISFASARASQVSRAKDLELEELGGMMRLVFAERLTDERKAHLELKPAHEIPGAQERIDRIFENVFSTPSGQRLCSEILQGDVSLIQYHIGVSPGAAQRIADGCQSSVRPSEHSMLINGRPQFAPRAYYFLIHGLGNDARFDSWTNLANQTVLMFNDAAELETSLHSGDEHPTAARLRDLLVHELAVYFDHKTTILEAAPATVSEQGIPMPEPRCAAHTALSNPVIRFAFASIRAFKFEARIQAGLGVHNSPPGERLDDAGCMSLLKTVIEEIMPAGPQLAAQSIYFDVCESNRAEKAALLVGPMTRLSSSEVRALVARDFDALTQAMREAGDREEAFCRYFTEPLLSGRKIHFNQGPRPRIKGWRVNEDCLSCQSNASRALNPLEETRQRELRTLEAERIKLSYPKIKISPPSGRESFDRLQREVR